MQHLNLSTSAMKKGIHFAALFLLLAVSLCLGAAWEGTDDFSSGISASNWTVQQTNHGQMTVQAANAHASFIVPISTTTDEQNAYIFWRGLPTAADDWMVDITGHNAAAYSGAGSSALQLAVVDTASFDASLEAYQVSMRRANPSTFSTGQWHGTGTQQTSISRASVPTTSVDFILRLVYRSTSRQMEAWYDPTASGSGWTKLDTISLAEFSPSMTTSSTFTFAILSNTYYGPISEGDIWADDFRITGSLPPRLLVAGAQWSAGFEVLDLTWTNNGSRCECIKGCDAVAKAADAACDKIKEPASKFLCKQAAAAAHQLCIDGCNSWCRNP